MPDGQLEDGSLLNERYRILRVIGQGGMGTVYQAEHERLNAVLAVKEIRGQPATGTAQQDTIYQYEQEARFLVKLHHPNLPKVTDAFVENGKFYLVMDFVEGVTLDTRLRERGGKPLEATVVVDWAVQIADVLKYLHVQEPPIIFRDLKPSNVMIQPDGVIKLIDFGIARRFQPGASKDTALLGSVGYSPPEQFGRHQTDTRSDIYSFGATLHHLLTAKDPSLTPFDFKPVDQINLGVPMRLTKLIAWCVVRESDRRPPDIETVEQELRSIRDELAFHAGGSPTGKSPTAVTGGLASNSTSGTMSGSRPALADSSTGRTTGGTFARTSDAKTRIAIGAALVALMGAGTAYAIHNMSKPTSNRPPSALNPPPAAPGVLPINRTGPGSSDPVQNGSNPAANPANSQNANSHDPPNTGEPTPPGIKGNDSGDSSAADCKVEVSVSPDGKAVRLHITGEIRDRNNKAGMVAAYFYSADKTPLPAKDPQGGYATKSGQLYAEFTFPIDADTKPIEGTMDIPMDQFSQTNGIMFQCVVYADNQSVGHTDLAPLVPTQPLTGGANQPHTGAAAGQGAAAAISR